MRKSALVTMLLIVSLTMTAQVKIDYQLGGANFIGFSLNTEFDISVNKEKGHFIMPRFGVGTLIPGWDEPTSILHFGLAYRIRKIAIGCEVSGFTPSPFFGSGNTDFVDMIVYPNLSYTIQPKKHPNWYYRISAGAYFAYSKADNYETDKTYMEFEGDVIPGAGITVGYRFNIVRTNK